MYTAMYVFHHINLVNVYTNLLIWYIYKHVIETWYDNMYYFEWYYVHLVYIYNPTLVIIINSGMNHSGKTRNSIEFPEGGSI